MHVNISANVFICAHEGMIRFTCSQFYQTSQSGRPYRASVEPLKSVINKIVKGTCMGSDLGLLV